MRPLILVIAGSDSSGGAGVDADLDALSEFPVEVRSLVTAWTRQDASGVRELGAVEPAQWLAEARGALSAGPLAALKLGLLPGVEAVRAATELIAELRASSSPELPVVLDPVIESSSGHRFLDEEALGQLRELLRWGPILTPNLPEAAALTGRELIALLEEPTEREAAARDLLAAGAHAVLLKGGHAEESPARDLLVGRAQAATWLEHERLAGRTIRGSGCRFASALAGGLACGEALEQAAIRAGELVLARLRESGPRS
jgi:hydroxymethylpyrimidine/phosphomethylpyrimidine kinase